MPSKLSALRKDLDTSINAPSPLPLPQAITLKDAAGRASSPPGLPGSRRRPRQRRRPGVHVPEAAHRASLQLLLLLAGGRGRERGLPPPGTPATAPPRAGRDGACSAAGAGAAGGGQSQQAGPAVRLQGRVEGTYVCSLVTNALLLAPFVTQYIQCYASMTGNGSFSTHWNF